LTLLVGAIFDIFTGPDMSAGTLKGEWQWWARHLIVSGSEALE
jgi:hypothetical protein